VSRKDKGVVMSRHCFGRAAHWLSLIGAAGLLAACNPGSPTSESPIRGASVSDDGHALLGDWRGELNGFQAYVHVVSAGGPGLLQTIVIANQKETRNGGGVSTATAIPANVSGAGILSVEVDQDPSGVVRDPLERGFHLVRYRVGPDQNYVTLYALDDDQIDHAIKAGEIQGDERSLRLLASSDELVKFIEKHPVQDLFSVQIGYLARISDDDLPKNEPR
jgi:hypothetical protein